MDWNLERVRVLREPRILHDKSIQHIRRNLLVAHIDDTTDGGPNWISLEMRLTSCTDGIRNLLAVLSECESNPVTAVKREENPNRRRSADWDQTSQGQNE